MNKNTTECAMMLLSKAIDTGFKINDFNIGFNDILGEAKLYILEMCDIDKYDECEWWENTISYSDDYGYDYNSSGEHYNEPHIRNQDGTFTKIAWYEIDEYLEKGEFIYWLPDVIVDSVGNVIQLYCKD